MRLGTLTTLFALCLTALALAAPARAIGQAPVNGTRYDCYGGSWKSIVFRVDGLGELRRGKCELTFPDGKTDTRFCDIFWHNNSPNWEFTLRRQAQCKNMYVGRFRGVGFLHFEQCEGVKNTFCVPR